MKNFNFFEKLWEHSRTLRRVGLVLVMCLITITQAWADEGNFYDVTIIYDYDGSEHEYTFHHTDNNSSFNIPLGTITSDFYIKKVWFKFWDDYGALHKWDNGQIAYAFNSDWSDKSYMGKDYFSTSERYNTNNYNLYNENALWYFKRLTDGSNNYTLRFYFHAWNGSVSGRDKYVNNSGKNYKFTFTIAPPAVSDYTVTPTGAIGGSGTASDPYIVPYGGNLQLDLSGASQAHTDANSSIQYSIDNSSWGTATANTRKIIENVTSTSVQNWVVYAKYYNSTAGLTGAVNGKTIYYRAMKVHEPGTYERATGSAGYGKTLKTYDGKKYELYYFSLSSSKGKLYAGESSPFTVFDNATAGEQKISPDAWVVSCARAYENSVSLKKDEMSNGSSSISSNYAAKLATGGNYVKVYISGYDQFTFFGHDQHASTAGKQFRVKIDGETQSFTHQTTDQTPYRFSISSGAHMIEIYGTGSTSSDDNYLRAFSLRLAEYTISYNKGSASGAAGSLASGKKYHNTNFTLSSVDDAFTRTGYTYDGWSVNEDGSTKDYEFGATYSTNAALTLYPHWAAAACSATAEAGANKATTVGVGVAMAATAASSGYTGAWSIKTGSPSTETSQLSSTSSATATFTPTAAGTYTLIWTVTDNNDGSCFATDEATVTVSRNTPTAYAVTGTAAICSGGNTNIRLANSQTGASYQLKNGGEAVGEPKAGETGSALTWNVSAAGTYTVSAVQTTKYSALDMTGSAVITFKTNTAIETQPTSIAKANVGAEQTLSVVATGSNLEYQWYSCSDAEKTGATELTGEKGDELSVTPAAAGVIYYYCVVSGDCGDDVTSNVVSITAKNQPAQYTVSGTASICSGSNTNITLSNSETGVSYQLYKDGVADGDPEDGSTGDAIVWTVSAAGTYTIKAEESSTYWERAMSGSATVSFKTATSISTQPATAVDATVNEDFTLGSALVAAGDGTLNYQWFSYSNAAGDADETSVRSASTTKTFTTSKAVAGTYYYRVKVIGGCGTVASDVIAVTVAACSPTSLVKTVITRADSKWSHTTTGVYSGTPVYNLSTEATSANIDGVTGDEIGYKMNGSGQYLYVQLSGTKLQAGDIIKVGVTKQNTNYEDPATAGTSDEKKKVLIICAWNGSVVGDSIGKITGVTGAGIYSYTVKASDLTRCGDSIHYVGLARNRWGQNPYMHSIEVLRPCAATTYTVTYANGGATGDVPVDASSPYEEGATVTVLDKGSLAKDGYSFGGWSANVNLTIDAAVVTAGTPIAAGKVFAMPATNVTLTAVWTPNTYDITYNLNGASWAGGYSAPANYTVGTGATLPTSSNMTNTGYTFDGWYDNSGLTGSSVTAIGTSEYGNKEFWAKWTENTYTITYNNNNVSATGSTADTEGHYVTVASCGFELDGYLFTGWNTESNGTGESYGAGEDIELTDNMTLYAQWATDYTIFWGDVIMGGSGATVTPNLGGGNYMITANTGSWTGSLDASMISSETSGVTITNVAVNNGGSPKTITVTFAVGAEVVGESIGLTLSVPAAGVYSAKESTKAITIDRCTGSGDGSDGVLFSAEFKDSGLGTSNICDAANTAYTFTTAELKSAATGGSIKAYTTSNLSHMKFATNAISIAGSNGVIQIDLDNAIQTNDLFTYLNVNSGTSSAYLRHTSADNETDQIALTGYNSREKKVMLPAGYNGKMTLYVVRNNNDFKLHKAAVVRPAFLMLLRDDTPTASSTNLVGNNVELTTENYLTTIQGGNAYYTSPSSGNLKIYRSSSKNYINFNSQAGYIKVVLDDALQAGDVIGFDSYNTNNLALTTTDVRSTSIVTTNQLYTVGSSSPLKGQKTFYIWQNGGSSDYLRGLQIARSGAAGGGGGTDQITTTLSWYPALNSDPDWNSGENRLNKETGDADFTFAAVQDKNSLGALTYSSSNTGVATVTAGGTVHIVGAAGDATITATMAESGCYKGATISYNIHVVDNCDDTPGHVMAYDLGCEGTRLFAVLYGGMNPEDVSFQWYKDGVSLGEEYRAQQCTVRVAGEYYAVVDNTDAGARHCAMATDNTVEVEAHAGISAEKIVDQWYVKNGRRTPDIALVQTTGATGFIVKIGDTKIWDSNGSVTTGFGGCGFRLGENGIIYLNGTKDNGDAPSGLTGDGETEILKITAKGCGDDADELSITIHKQVPDLGARPSVAFVVDGTEKGRFDQPNADHSTNSALYQFLDYTLSGGSGQLDLTAQNIYSSVDEKELLEHYSQFDAIIITDDPSTGKKKDGKSYVDAMGALIDVRPILTMEAFVSKLANWKAKGINGNPESPSPRQYAMTLQCKDHEIFGGLSVGPNVQEEEIDGVDYWTVTMVDKTKSPYSSKASDTDDTGGTPALQGFSASDVSGLLLLGEIKNGDKTMYAGVERQEEPAARLMLLGLNNKALPNALTTEGKLIVENAVRYLLKTNMEEVDDCSNYFVGTIDKTWDNPDNWAKKSVPNSPMMRVRILAPCEVSTTVHAAHIDIVTSGESSKKGGEMTGQLTIKPNGAVIVGGEVRAAEAPYFNKSDLKPTEEQDLVIETNGSNQGALILNNDAGDTKATVEYYSLGRKDGSVYQFQYFASPMGYLEINPAFAGAGIYTYAWNEAVADGWERRAYYTDVLGFEGLAITTKRDYNSTYTLKGALASTADVDIPLTYTDAGAGGQNLIGNSWTAPINIASLVEAFEDDANVDKTVNIYNSGNDDYPGLGAAGTWTSVPISVAEWPEWKGLKVIPAMQAFRIDVTSETKLTMNYEKMVRETESSSLNEPLKAPSRRSNANGASLMRMRMESGMAHTDLFLIEGGQFSDAFDNGYEAKFIAGEDNTVQFYAMNGEEKMAVLATDALEGTPVGFVPGKGTTYTISFSGEGKGYYLNDVKTQTSTLISEENTYSFDYEAGDDANRFYISTTPFAAPSVATDLTNMDAEAPKVMKVIYNDKLYIIRGGKVFSADGQLVK